MSTFKNPTVLGTERISTLLMHYAIPGIIAMTASSLYNMVDSIFIGQGVGPMAISGLALTFPLMNLSTAFGTLVGVGASTLISVKFGQRDYETAQHILGNVVVLNVIFGLGFVLGVMPFLDDILYFFGGSEETVPYAREYMFYILLGNVFTHLYFGLNAVLRASGHPNRAMFATLNTVIINILLDPLFIYVFDMGIKGAAVATVLSQCISLVWQLRIFCNQNELLHFRRGIFKLKRKITVDSLAVGMSPFLMNIAACFVVVLINQGFKTHGGEYGDLTIGAYGIVNRIAFIFMMIIMGFNQGMQPIAGYNFGARQYGRVLEVFWKTVFCATVILTIAFLTAMFLPRYAVSIFTDNETLISLATHGLRVSMMFFPIISLHMISTNLFQSIGMAKKAIFLSLMRQVLVLIPLLFILPIYWGVDGVWYSMPVSDLASSVIAILMLVTQLRKFKQMEA